MDVGGPCFNEALPCALIQRNRAWKEAASAASALPARGNSETSRLHTRLSMPLRLMPALCVLLLAGCTSSEPQNASYAPLATAPSLQAAPVAAAPALQATPTVVPAISPVSELQSQPTAFPPPDSTGLPRADTASAAILPPGATNCSTVDGVTLCDAPADPSTDDAQYTN